MCVNPLWVSIDSFGVARGWGKGNNCLRMVIWVLPTVGLLSVFLLVGFFSWTFQEWIWRPWCLIYACQEQKISGFPFIPFVGQLPQISKAFKLLNKDFGLDWEGLRSVQETVKTHGKVFYFTAGKTVRICITDPELVKHVLATNADSYAKPSFIQVLDILGAGLFASSGEVWASQRQLLALSFANKEIKTKMGTITSCALTAIDKWFDNDTKSSELQTYQRLLELTLCIIEKIAFGAEESKAALVAGALDRYLRNCRELVFGSAASIPGYKFLPTGTNREILKDQTMLSDVIEELIQARSRAHDFSASQQTSHTDVLDLLLSAVPDGSAQKITSQQLRDNAMTILLAGHHTTASLLTWTMYMLALEPEWQARARAEVAEVCVNGVVDWRTLPQLKSITMILSETLRLFPPIPLIGRLCLKENKIDSYIIPSGVEIFIPTAVIHRDKELWGEDANQFEPTRFANGIGKACKHPLGYLPFGNGPRTCIGQTLALAEARAVLAVLLPKLSWKLGPGYRHCPDIVLTLQPKFDIPLIMERL